MSKRSELQARRKLRMAKKISAMKSSGKMNNMGIGHDVMEPVQKRKSGKKMSEAGVSIPEEIMNVVEESSRLDESANKYMGVVTPEALRNDIQAFVSIEDVESDKDTVYSMVPFCIQAGTSQELLAAGCQWMLCANSHPLAFIQLKDQDNVEHIAAHFISDDYAAGVRQSIADAGLRATMAAVKAVPYAMVIDRDEELSKEKGKLQASFTAQLREETSRAKSHLMSTSGLVIKAMTSNFITKNPLKDSLINKIVQSGVSAIAANDLVDQAFQEQGQNTLSAMLDQSEEWANTPAEAMTCIEKAINDAGQRTRNLPELVQANTAFNTATAAQYANAAVPVVHTSSLSASAVEHAQATVNPQAPATSRRDEIKAKLSFGRRR